MKISISLIILMLMHLNAKEICPKICICDIYEGYKRADCSEQNLISPDVNLAKSVEILNLSGNLIATIDKDFDSFIELINLSLSKNNIHSIELFAFASLEKLTYLDLSDNRLEIIDNRVIEYNEKLSVLDLSKNKFMMLDDAPLLISKSLEFLSLRGSHLSFIYDSFFSKIPNILDLDLSNNLLITLKSSNFFPLEKLQFINLEYNDFKCDTQTEQAIQFFKTRKVFIKIDKCLAKKPMFEKMILLAPNSEEDESKEDIEIDLVWGKSSNNSSSDNSAYQNKGAILKEYYTELKNNLEDESYCKNGEFDSMLCECRQKYITLYEMTNRTQIIQKNNIEMRLHLIFYVGLLIGAVSGCLIFYCILLIKRKCQSLSRKQMNRQHLRDQIVREYTQEVRMTEIPLIAQIQQPQPRASPVMRHRSELSSSSPSTSSRHQFNPQSSLAQSRLRSDFSSTTHLLQKLFRKREANNQARQQSSTAATAPIIPPRRRQLPEVPSVQVPIVITSPSPNESGNESDSEYLSINGSIILETQDRSTTPPPAYREIFD